MPISLLKWCNGDEILRIKRLAWINISERVMGRYLLKNSLWQLKSIYWPHKLDHPNLTIQTWPPKPNWITRFSWAMRHKTANLPQSCRKIDSVSIKLFIFFHDTWDVILFPCRKHLLISIKSLPPPSNQQKPLPYRYRKISNNAKTFNPLMDHE